MIRRIGLIALASLGAGCEVGGGAGGGTGGGISGLLPETGALAFHSSTGRYGTPSNLVVVDLRGGRPAIVEDDMWGQGLAERGPLNPAFSPSGRKIAVYAGSPAGWYDLFEFELTAPATSLRRLSSLVRINTDESFEDPHYLAEDLIIAKHLDGPTFKGLIVLDTAGALLARFTGPGGEELSRPILRTRLGQSVIVCWMGAGDAARLVSFSIDLSRVRAGLDQGGATVAFTDLLPGQASGSYYPSPSLDSDSVVFFSWRSAARNDMIWRLDLNASPAAPIMLPINDPGGDNSDAISLGGGRMAFSRVVNERKFDLFAGLENSFFTSARDIDSLGFPQNTATREELGPAYHPSAEL